jgi:hypothetical protein
MQLDALTEQDTAARRHVLERIFREAREHPENLNITLGPPRSPPPPRSWWQACQPAGPSRTRSPGTTTT